MFVTIFNTVSDIEIRLANQWHPNELPTAQPDMSMAKQHVERIRQLLLSSGDTADSEGIAKQFVKLQCLIKCQQQLSLQLWPQLPLIADKHQQMWHHHDVMVYGAICDTSIKACRLFSQFEWETKLPPLTSLLPKLQDTCYGQIDAWDMDPSFDWWKHLQHAHSLLPLPRAMHGLRQAIAGCQSAHPLLPLINSIVEGKMEVHLHDMAAERRVVDKMVRLSELIAQQWSSQSVGEQGRVLVRFLLELPFDDDFFILDVAATYRQSVLSIYCFNDWENELTYWKSIYASVGRLNQCFLAILEKSQQLEAVTAASDDPSDKLSWKGSGEELAKLFVDLTKKGMVRYKGNGDITPLALKLFKVFSIEKVRGEGALTESSLVSYFKKSNADFD